MHYLKNQYFTKGPENTQHDIPLVLGLIQRIFNQKDCVQYAEEYVT